MASANKKFTPMKNAHQRCVTHSPGQNVVLVFNSSNNSFSAAFGELANDKMLYLP